MMEHKGYTARVEYDSDAEIFHGQVMNLRDVVTFQGRSVDELKEAFVDSVEDYLDFCASRGEEPEKPYSGKFLVRVDPTIHRQIAIASALANESLNSWVARVLADASSLIQAAAVGSRQFPQFITSEQRRETQISIGIESWPSSRRAHSSHADHIYLRKRLQVEQAVSGFMTKHAERSNVS